MYIYFLPVFLQLLTGNGFFFTCDCFANRFLSDVNITDVDKVGVPYATKIER